MLLIKNGKIKTISVNFAKFFIEFPPKFLLVIYKDEKKQQKVTVF